jgi:hypothetical protein
MGARAMRATARPPAVRWSRASREGRPAASQLRAHRTAGNDRTEQFPQNAHRQLAYRRLPCRASACCRLPVR